MRRFKREVSDKQYTQAPMPNDDDIAMLAYCLGALMQIGLPILRVVRITQESTLNLRLHYMLAQIIRGFETGTLEALLPGLSNHPDLLSDEFIICLAASDAPKALLEFSVQNKKNPALLLANVVERPLATIEFTNLMNSRLDDSLAFDKMLEKIIEQGCSPNTTLLANKLCAQLKIEQGTTNAFYALMNDYFDYFYMNIVDWCDEKQTMGLAFKLLATS